MKKYILVFIFSLIPLFSFDNHFVGIIATTGTLEEPSVNIDDNSFVSLGFKTGILNDNIMVYADYQHFTFSIESDNKNYNEDLLSFGIGPVFKLIEYIDLSFYINGVVVVDKFHYSEEILKDKYNKYLSQYQLFLGYEFGLVFPIQLNPFHNASDSFIEFGYRQVHRNDSVLDSANSEESKEIEPFTEIHNYFFGINFLF
jgi:hypothetical protein